MKKIFRLMILILFCLLAFSGIQYFLSSDVINNIKDYINENFDIDFFDTKLLSNYNKTSLSNNEYESYLELKYKSGDIFNDDQITFDDETLAYYKDMYYHYTGLQFENNNYKSNSKFQLNDSLYILTRLTSVDGDLFLCSKFQFKYILSDDSLSEEYIDNLYIDSVEIYIPDSKFEPYIEIASITKNGIVVKNELVYSPFKLYSKGNNLASMFVSYYDDGFKTAFINCNNFETELVYGDKSGIYTKDWTSEVNRIGDSIFVDMFSLKYKEDLQKPTNKVLTYDDAWISEMFNKNGRFTSIYEDDPMLLSYLKCRALNYSYVFADDPDGLLMVLQFGLFDLSTNKSRTFHLIVDFGGIDDGIENVGYNYENGVANPVNDSYEYIELAEIIDGHYVTIIRNSNGTLYINDTLDVSNCIYNYDISNGYYSLNMFNVDGSSVSDYNLVSLNETDITELLFEKIFYFVEV